MKVFIITEGGENIGLGHITRCTSIYQAFEEAGIKPQLIVNGDQTVGDLLTDKSCKVFNWLNDRKALLAAVQNADIVFVDSYLADYDLYEKLSSVVKTAVYIDDNVRLNYPKGFVLNGAIFAEQMRYPKRKEVNYLLGAQYAPLRKEFWDISDKPIRDNLETVLITFGGIDSHNVTPKVLKLLKDAYPALLKKVIISKSFQNIAEIEKLKDSNTELVYYPNAAQMRKVMLESDIAISAGGQTLNELARVGVPTIGICIAENQSQNIEGWRKSGFLKYAGWCSEANLEQRLKNFLRYLTSKRIRMRMSKIGRKVIDGQGYKRIINAINAK